LNSKECTLCGSKADLFYSKSKIYNICRNCKGIHLESKFYLNHTNEKLRYETHNNDVEDPNYQNFVSPITSSILKDFHTHHIGLDFGAGTGPVISKVLQDNHYQIHQYDPFFHPNDELLNNSYDYIACCEVIEHFHNPNKEFQLLHKLLNENGKLYIMTDMYSPDLNFDKWYYKNDPTHVFFYQTQTIEHIAKSFNFSDFTIDNRLIIFSK